MCISFDAYHGDRCTAVWCRAGDHADTRKKLAEHIGRDQQGNQSIAAKRLPKHSSFSSGWTPVQRQGRMAESDDAPENYLYVGGSCGLTRSGKSVYEPFG